MHGALILFCRFTGTQLCADPVRKIYTILLTNRVYPLESNEAILPVRQEWNTEIQQILDAQQWSRSINERQGLQKNMSRKNLQAQ